MTLTKLLNVLCLAGLGVFIFSCDNSSSYDDRPESVKVLSVEASTNFDLSARSNWKFLVHGCYYSYEIVGNKLIATPASTSDTFAFSVTSTNKSGYAVLTFISPNYFKTRSELVVPDIQDQSTPEKFMACDVLRGEYNDVAKSEISVTFFHENALLQFETIDFPDDAKVYVEQKYGQVINPLRDKEDPAKYRAIVLPQNYQYNVYIVVETGGKTYKTPMREKPRTRTNITYFDGLGQSAVVNFKVRIGDEDKLIIEDYDEASFVKTWPITE